MKPGLLLFLYVVALLAAMVGVGVYYHFRRKRFAPEASEDRVFRCDRCHFVYTDDADVDRSRCPQCGALNDSFRF